MKILYFHQYFCTPAGAGGVRSYEFARRWVSAGHHVMVVTSCGSDLSLTRGTQNIDGITVRCVGGRYRSTYGFTARLWAFCLFAFRATMIAICSRKYDVVLATSTPLTVAIPALAAKLVARRPVVFEVRDVWPDAAVEAGVLKNPVLIWLARTLEKAAYRLCNHIVPLSTGMQERIRSKGVPQDKMTMLPNCSDLTPFDPTSFDRNKLREELAPNNRFIILYVGAINLANDMPFLARAISQLKDDDQVCWWFVGGGNRFDYLKEQVAQADAKNVVFWGKQPKSAVPKFVNAADVGVVSFINQPVYYENSPNKFFDYCAGGLPVIFTRTTWLKAYLEEYEAGLVCENNTVEEFCEHVQTIKDNPSQRKQMGTNARRMAEQEFARDKIAASYLDLLTQQIQGHGTP